MARSSLSGIDRAAPTPTGHESASLGPSDSSDSGSDIAGIEGLEGGDPSAPVDVAMSPDTEHPGPAAEMLGPGFDTDAAGTGERRSAGGDAGRLDAPDIAPDHVVSISEISATSEESETPLAEEPEPGDVRAAEAVMAEPGEAEENDPEQPTQRSPVPRRAPRTSKTRSKRVRGERSQHAQAKGR